MTITVSAWDAAAAAVLAAVLTQPAVTQAGANILVQEGMPGPDQPEDILIVNTGVHQTAVPHWMVGSGGSGWLEETFRVGVRIEVYRGGDDAPATRTRCKALADAVDVAVRTDPSLGGAVLWAYPASHTFSAADWDSAGKGRLMSCEMEIECMARI